MLPEAKTAVAATQSSVASLASHLLLNLHWLERAVLVKENIQRAFTILLGPTMLSISAGKGEETEKIGSCFRDLWSVLQLQGIHWPGKIQSRYASNIWEKRLLNTHSHWTDLSKVQYFCHLKIIGGIRLELTDLR